MEYSIVKNIEQQFDEIKDKGHFLRYTSLGYSSHLADEHVQGCTKAIINDIEYTIFSHSISKSDKQGFIFRKSGATSKDTLKKAIPDGWKHPGGIQAIGKYLYVACENGSASKLFVFDLSQPKDMPIVYEQEFSCHSASSVGITNVTYNNKDSLLLVMNSTPCCHFYISDVPANDSFSNVRFNKIGELSLRDSDKDGNDYENIALFTEVGENGENVYMFVPENQPKGISYHDHAELYKLKIDPKIEYPKVSVVSFKKRKLCRKGGVGGFSGVHFRWGACAYIDKNGKLTVFATARSMIAGTLETNTWYS